MFLLIIDFIVLTGASLTRWKILRRCGIAVEHSGVLRAVTDFLVL